MKKILWSIHNTAFKLRLMPQKLTNIILPDTAESLDEVRKNTQCSRVENKVLDCAYPQKDLRTIQTAGLHRLSRFKRTVNMQAYST